MIPLAIPNISGNEGRYLQECVKTNYVSSVGPFVTRLEEMAAGAADAGFGVATSSGTSALHLALLALGVGRDDLVILPSYTFIASANAISHCGAAPWLFDISPDSWTLDCELLAETLETETIQKQGQLVHRKSGRRVAALMPVYTLGMPAQMKEIREVGQKYGLPVIADAAAALGANYHGANIGRLADITALSFNGNKTVTAGGGGMVLGNDDDVMSLVRHLSTTARRGTDYDHDRVGFNYRMTNLQAAVGCAQLERLDEFVAAKRRIDRVYRAELGVVSGIGFFPVTAWARSACWFTGITLLDDRMPSVAEICQRLREKGIEARTFWKPIHLQQPYKDVPRTTVKVSDRVWGSILTLPSSTQLTEDEQSYVITTLKGLLT